MSSCQIPPSHSLEGRYWGGGGGREKKKDANPIVYFFGLPIIS